MKWLDRLREKTPASSPMTVTKVTEGAFGAFVTALPEGNQFSAGPVKFSPRDAVAAKYPADLIGAPCPNCGSVEKWLWVDGTLICREGLLRGDHLGRSSEAGKNAI